jgi:hypothetical protein
MEDGTMHLSPDESQLNGRWITHEGQTVTDETGKRIQDLIRFHLKELARDPSGWDTLYFDPTDGRLWELTYPQSEAHGGGPPRLCALPEEDARLKYGHAGPPAQ